MGMIVGMCVIVYLIIKGISIYGLLLLMIGVTAMFGYFADLIYKLLYNNLHIYSITNWQSIFSLVKYFQITNGVIFCWKI